jgi:hypothetical protein
MNKHWRLSTYLAWLAAAAFGNSFCHKSYAKLLQITKTKIKIQTDEMNK